MKLQDIKGPLLLYMCRGASVHGHWEPVLGPAPGPHVQLYKEVHVRCNGNATQSSLLLLPGIGSMVLDVLFNYTMVDWSCNSGLSSLEAMLCAVRVWKSMRACSFVCRTWRDALQPFSSLTKICHHALQIPVGISEELLKTLKLPTVSEAVRAITFAAPRWNAGLRIPRSASFQGKAWPGQISQVQLKSQMSADEDHFLKGPSAASVNRYAPTFLKFAKKMLQLPLPWKTKPYCTGVITTGDGRQFATCDLQEFSGKNNKSSCVLAQADHEGHMNLFSCDGAAIVPNHGDLEPLVSQGLRFRSISRHWRASSKKAIRPTDPCDFYMPECTATSPCEDCKNDVEGRRRLGHSDLLGGYVLEFMDGPRQISLEINVKILPFHATSKDSSLVSELESLLPWCGSVDSSSDSDDDDEDHEDDDESDEDQEDVEDEDDGEDAEDDGEDLEEEDAERDAESDGEAEGCSRSEGPLRRRLRGKQPPPPTWR